MIMIIFFAQKQYRFVNMAMLTFALITLYNIIMFIISLTMVLTSPFLLPIWFTILVIASALDIIIMILWIVYLSKSDRVHNTFKRKKEVEE